MRQVAAILLTGLLLSSTTSTSAAKVIGVPAAVAKKWEIDTKWYKQYTTIRGIPIIASKQVDSSARLNQN